MVHLSINKEAFLSLFQPLPNHLNPNASFNWDREIGTLFETVGDEFAFVQQQEPTRVWTLICGDGCDFVGSGFHFVNRLGYFISKLPVPEGVQIIVECQDEQPLPYSPLLTEGMKTAVIRLLDYLWDDEQRATRQLMTNCTESRTSSALCEKSGDG